MHVLGKRLALLEFNLIYISFARRCRRARRGESAVPDQLHGARGEHWLLQLFMHVTINWAAWLPFDCDSFELVRSTLVSHRGGNGGADEPHLAHTSAQHPGAASGCSHTYQDCNVCCPTLVGSGPGFGFGFCLRLCFDATRCGLAWLGLFGLHFSWEISLMEIITFDYFSN